MDAEAGPVRGGGRGRDLSAVTRGGRQRRWPPRPSPHVLEQRLASRFAGSPDGGGRWVGFWGTSMLTAVSPRGAWERAEVPQGREGPAAGAFRPLGSWGTPPARPRLPSSHLLLFLAPCGETLLLISC